METQKGLITGAPLRFSQVALLPVNLYYQWCSLGLVQLGYQTVRHLFGLVCVWVCHINLLLHCIQWAFKLWLGDSSCLQVVIQHGWHDTVCLAIWTDQFVRELLSYEHFLGVWHVLLEPSPKFRDQYECEFSYCIKLPIHLLFQARIPVNQSLDLNLRLLILLKPWSLEESKAVQSSKAV